MTNDTVITTVVFDGEAGGLVGASDEVVGAFGNVGQALDQVNSAGAEAGQGAAAAGADMAGAGEKAAEASESTGQLTQGFSALSSVARSLNMNELGSALKDVGEGAKALTEGAGEAGISLAGVMGIAAAAAAVVGGLGMVAADDANSMMRLSAVMGTSEEDTKKWAIAMEMAGGSSSSLTTAVNRIGAQADAGSAALTRLGVATHNADGSMMSAGEVFEGAITKIAGMSSAVDRHNAVVEIFGARYSGQIIPLVEHFAEIMPKAGEAADKASKSLNPEAAIKYNMAMAELNVDITNIGAQVLPLLVGAMNVADGTMTTLGMVASGLGGEFSAAVSGVESLWHSIEGGAEAAINPVIGVINDLIRAWDALPFTHDIEPVQKLGSAMSDAGTAMGTAAGEASGLAGAEDGVADSTGKVSAALEKMVNGLNLSKYGFEASSAGAEAGAQSMAAYVDMLGDATQAAIAFANAQGQTVTISSSGTSTFSSVPARASGGPVNAGQLYRVNENNVELFRPSTDGEIIPLEQGSGTDLRGGSASPAFGGEGGGATLILQVNLNGPVYGMADAKRQVGQWMKEVAMSQTYLRSYLKSG